jgi:DNA-binding LytR/AlgR family response regulator
VVPLVADVETSYFTCTVDGNRQLIPHIDIQYIESLENYQKIVTKAKTYVTRLTLKEAEERLPKRQFIRISRSYIVNTGHVDRKEADAVWIGPKELPIGKVYKRYVADQFFIP